MNDEQSNLQGSSLEPSTVSPGTTGTNDVSASNYTSQIGQEYSSSLETIDVKDPYPAPFSQPSQPAPTKPTAPKGVISKRKLIVVSAVITFVVLMISTISLAYFARQSARDDLASQNPIPTQDIQLPGSSEGAPQLQGAATSLLINGDVITTGSLKVTDGEFVSIIQAATLSKDQTYQLPNASGTFCLSSNNCDLVTNEDLAAVVGLINQPDEVPTSTLLNGMIGGVTLQGTGNQIIVTNSNGVITLSTPQDIGTTSSPTFASATLSGNLNIGGTLTLPIDCTIFLNGGSLTTDNLGQVMCTNDESSGAGSSVTTAGGTPGTIPLFTSPDVIGDSLLTQSGSTISVAGNLSAFGNGLFRNTVDSTTSFQIQNTAGNSALTVDTAYNAYSNLITTNSTFEGDTPSYSTGTISQGTTGPSAPNNTITGTGTTFTPAMVGQTLVYNDCSTTTITGYTSATVITVADSKGYFTGQSYSIGVNPPASWVIIDGGAANPCLNTVSTPVHGGSRAMKITTTTNKNDGARIPVALSANTAYVFTAWIRSDTNTAINDIVLGHTKNNGFFGDGDSDCAAAQSTVTGVFGPQYTQFICSFSVGASVASSPSVYIRRTNTALASGVTFYVDNVSLYSEIGNSLIVGSSGSNLTNLKFIYDSGSTITLQAAFGSTGTGNHILTIPAESGVICTTANTSICTTGNDGKFLSKVLADTASAQVGAGGYLYSFSNSDAGDTGGVLRLLNGVNTGAALRVESSLNASLNAVNANSLLVSATNSGANRFKVYVSGKIGINSGISEPADTTILENPNDFYDPTFGDLSFGGNSGITRTINQLKPTTTDASGGTLKIAGAEGNGTGTGGTLLLQGGNAESGGSGTGGAININSGRCDTAGEPTCVDDGDITIRGDSVHIRPWNNSTTSFRVTQSNLTDLFTIDTTSRVVNLLNNTSFLQTGNGTFGTGTGAISLNGNVTQSGSNTFSTGTGNVSLNGDVTIASGRDLTQSGASTFTTGTGTTTLNGDVTLNADFSQAGTNTFSTGTGNVSLNGNTTVAANRNFVQNGTGTFGTGTGAISLNGAITLISSFSQTGANTFSTGTGAVNLNGATTLSSSFTFNGDAFTDLTGTGLQISGGALQTTLGTDIDLTTEVTGVLPVLNGGTGASDATTARSNLSAAQSGANSDITSITGLTAITPTSALTIGDNGETLTLQGDASSSLSVTDAGFTATLNFAAPTSNYAVTVPDAGGNDNVCLENLGNCAGSGGGVTGTGTNNQIAKFTSTGSTIGDSTLTDDGSNVTTSVDFIVQGGQATLGAALQAGSLVISDGSSNTATIVVAPTTNDYTYTIPDAGVNDEFCLLALQNCSGSGGGNAPTNAQYLTLALDGGLSAERTLSFNGTNFSVSDGGANGAYSVNTIQDIDSSATPNFAGLAIAGTASIQGSNSLSLGTASTNTGSILFYGSGSANGITLRGPTAPGAGLTLTLPNETGTLCSTGSVCAGYAASTGASGYIQNGTSTQSSANFNIQSASAGSVGGVIQGATSQTADLLQLRDSVGATLLGVSASGNIETTGQINSPYGGMGQIGNLLNFTESLHDVTAWTATNLSVAIDSHVAPNSILSAEGLTALAVNGTLEQTYGTSTIGYYTFSVWLKTSSGTTNVDLRIDSTGPNVSGAANSVTANTTWQRFYVTQQITGSTTGVVPKLILPSNGSSVQAWGAQLARGTSPQVYIHNYEAPFENRTGLVANGNLVIDGADSPYAAVDIRIGVSGGALSVTDLTGNNVLNISTSGAVQSDANITANGGFNTGSASLSESALSLGTGITFNTITEIVTSNGGALGTSLEISSSDAFCFGNCLGGGDITLISGNGGTTGNADSAGGDIVLTAGNGGTLAGTGGSINIQAGDGVVTDGSISIGTSHSPTITIGSASAGALAFLGSTVGITANGAGNDITLAGADQILLNPANGVVVAANQDFSNITAGTGTLTWNNSVTNASDSAIVIGPGFAGGATNSLTYNGISLNGFSPTNAAGTDTVNGVNIGNLTDPGATITSRAVQFGTGWDTVISGTTAGTNLISFTNFGVTSAGAITGASLNTGAGSITTTGTVFGNTFDRSTAGLLNIATGNATSLAVGSASVTGVTFTTDNSGGSDFTFAGDAVFNNDLSVTQESTFTGDATFNGNVDLIFGSNNVNLAISQTLVGNRDIVAITGTAHSTPGVARGIVITNATSAHTNGLDDVIEVIQLEESAVISSILKVTNTGGGAITNVFDILGVGINATEIGLLDGRDAALVDTNDAVATAITGTGALNAGSITSGFGAINVGTDNITTTGTIFGNTLDRSTAGLLNIGTGGASAATSIVLGSASVDSTTFTTNNNSTSDFLFTGGATFNNAVTLASDLFLTKEVAHQIKLNDSTTAATAGAQLSIVGANGNAAGGGAVVIQAGNAGSGFSTGGAVNITAGSSPSWNGGAINITGGSGNFVPGTVTIQGGNANTAGTNDIAGGLTVINGGQGVGTGAGGAINFQTAPAGVSGNSANALIQRLQIQADGDIVADTSTFFLDATNDRVGIGDATPQYTLTVGSGDLFGIQGTDGSLIWEGTSADANETVLTVVNPTADITYRLADAAAGTYDICTTVGNCVGVGGGVSESGTNVAGQVAYFTADSNITSDADFLFDGTNVTLGGDLAVNGGDITSTGALTVTPGAGNNLNITLSGTGDFAVNSNQLYVDTSTGNVGVGDSTPDAQLDIDSTFTTSNVFGVATSTITTGDILNLQNNSAVSAGSDIIYGRHMATYVTTVNNSGSLLELDRVLSTNTGGALTQSGDVGWLTSNCTVIAGTCTDTSNILELDQQYASATGAVLNVLGAGTGNLATYDATNASANGISIDIQSSSSSQYALDVRSANGTSRLYVRADGNIGIGDATPLALLTVGAGDLFQVQSTGKVQTINGTAASPAYSFTGAADMGIYAVGTNNIGISTVGTERIRIDSNGDVGIGITSNGPTLSVGGTLAVSSNFFFAGQTATDYYINYASGFELVQNSFQELFIDPNTHRWGIADASPDAKFDIDATFSPAATGTTNNTGIGLTVSNTVNKTSGIDNTYGQQLTVTRTGASGGTIDNYGLQLTVTGDTGGTSTNTGLSVNVSGADTNYAALFQGGNVGIGDTTPAALFTVGSGDLFQVNSSGEIAAAAGITTSGFILPSAADSIDLGSATAEWDEIYLGDGGGLVLGADQDVSLSYDEATDDRVELTAAVAGAASLFIEDRLGLGVQTLTLTDDGVTNDALTPTTSYVRIDINEGADGSVPDVTISEASAKDGDILIIVNNEQDASEDSFTITNSAGVVQLPGGATLTLGPNDAVTLIYMNDRWVTLSNSNN